MNAEYKVIKYFSRYAISKGGVVINIKKNRTVVLRGCGLSVNITSDMGDRTSRTIKGLLLEAWGSDEQGK